jgi:hypothetical protein
MTSEVAQLAHDVANSRESFEFQMTTNRQIGGGLG